MTYLNPEQSSEKRAARADSAASQFAEAAYLADGSGMLLLRRTQYHFQLLHQRDGWIVNIYPSNRRIYHDKNHRGPFLKLPHDWDLLSVVRAAACSLTGAYP